MPEKEAGFVFQFGAPTPMPWPELSILGATKDEKPGPGRLPAFSWRLSAVKGFGGGESLYEEL